MPNLGKWLKEKKAQEKKARLQTQNQFSAPIGARFNTGFGPDGVLQPDRPTAQFQSQNGPVNVHEGEQLRPGVGGNVNVIPQEQLMREEQQLGIPGFQRGGSFKPIGGPGQGARPGQRQRPGQGPNTGIIGTGDLTSNIQNPRQRPLNNQLLPDPNIGQNQNTGQNVGMVNNQLLQDPNIGQNINMGDPTIPDPVLDPIINTQNIGQVGDPTLPDPVIDPIINTQNIGQVDIPQLETPQLDDILPVGPITYPQTQSSADPVDPDTGVTDPTVPTPDENEYSDDVKFALAELRKMYEGGSPAQRAAYQRAIDNLKATQATERRVGAQQAAQGRVGGVEAETRQLVQARDAGMQLAEATAQMGISDLQSRENALNTMVQIGLQGQQLEQSADQWQQQFDFAKQQYGDQEGQRIFADINAGMTWDQIKEKYPDANVTKGAFDSMQNATPMSQWEKMFGFDKQKYQEQFDFAKEKYDFDKQISAVNTLMQQGGAENFEQASKLFKDMFGENIDFSNALNEENKDNFNDGMAQMSTYLATGLTWDQAVEAMKKDGTYDKLIGDELMIEEDVENMYNQMRLQSNPIWQADQAYQDLVDNNVISQEMKDQIMDVMMFTLSNPEGVEIVEDKYVVKDENGNVQAEFDTQQQADMFLQTSGAADKGWTSSLIEGGVQLSDTTGNGTGTGTGTQANDNEAFVAFEGAMPDPEMLGVVTQEYWKAAGKPKTWEEFENADLLKAFDIDTLLKDGELTNEEDVKRIADLVSMGNKEAIKKFKVNDKINSKVNDYVANPTKRISSKENAKLLTDIQGNIGKIINIGGEDRVILGVDNNWTQGVSGTTFLTYFKITTVDPETRELKTILIENKN